MVNTSEKVIERYFFNRVKKAKGLCIKLIALHFAGLPDRLILLPGAKIFFVEFKSFGFKPEPLQVVVHARLRALGFKVYIIDSIQLAESVLNEYI